MFPSRRRPLAPSAVRAAGLLAQDTLLILLGVVLLESAAMQFARLNEEPGSSKVGTVGRLRLAGVYHSIRLERDVPYAARRVPLGFGIMWLAGIVSGLLGIGSGARRWWPWTAPWACP